MEPNPVANEGDPGSASPGFRPAGPIVALSTAVFAGAASMRCLDAVLPSIASGFGRSIGAVGAAASAYAISYSAFQLIHGPLGDRIGAFRIVTWAAWLSALAAGACALAPSISVLVGLRFGSGAIAAAIGPLALAWVSRATKVDDRPVALARMTAAAILGTAAGQVGGGVIGGVAGWRFVFVVLAALFVAAGLAMVGLARRRPDLVERSSRTPNAAPRLAHPLILLRHRSVKLVLVAVGLEGFGIYLSLTYVGALLHDRLSLGPAHTGLVVSLYGAGGVAFVVVAPRILGLGSMRIRAVVAGVLLGAGFVTLGMSSREVVLAAALFVVGFGFLMMHNILQMMATRMAPQALATSLSLFAAASSMSQAFGAAGGGYLFDQAGPTPGYLLSAIILTGLGVAISCAVMPPTEAADTP